MNSGAFTESAVEPTALAWLESDGWQVRNGAEIAPGEPATERDDYAQVVLAQRLRESLLPRISGYLQLRDTEKLVGRAL